MADTIQKVYQKPSTNQIISLLGTVVLLLGGLFTLHATVVMPSIMRQVSTEFASKEQANAIIYRMDTLATRMQVEALDKRVDRIEDRLTALEHAGRAGPK